MSLLGELKRRNVLRVGAAYAALSWLAIQIVETLFPLFGLSDATARMVVVLLAIGFVPALVIAWAFELTPDGLKRDSAVDRDSPVSQKMTRRLDHTIMLFLVLALTYFAVDKFVIAPGREIEAIDESIAVLPFDDLSPDSDQAWFSDGISEELLNLLAKVEDLRVISRSSSFALRDENLSIPEMAERLNVTYILEGSVRRVGDQIRITAQLIDARTDTHMWSETYDRQLDDVFAIQDQISAQVVKELELQILGSAPASNVTDIESYELYLRGIDLLARREAGDIEQAIQMFEQVISLDSNYVPAYGSLALAFVWSDLWPEPRFLAVETAAYQALALDPDNADAHAALGRIRYEQGRTVEARHDLERAIDAVPNHALAFRWLGQSYSAADPVRYLELAREALDLDPEDPTIRFHTSSALSLMGRHDDAMSEARALLARGRDEAGYAQAARFHFLAGNLDEALLTNFLIFKTAGQRFAITRVLTTLDDALLAKAWLEEPAGSGYMDSDSIFSRGQVLLQLGEKQLALDLIGDSSERSPKSMRAIDIGAAHILFDGDFDIARAAFDKAFARPGQDIPQFEPDQLPYFIHYALSLQRTGETERATKLIREIKELIASQLAEGVVVGPFDNHLQAAMARLHAMSGEAPEATTALRRALEDGYLCAHCLRTRPHFDSLREEPDFIAVLAEYESKIAIQRQRLADAGVLVAPEELLALEDFDYDPFSR